MKREKNKPILKDRRRELRKGQTAAETLLWKSLRAKQLGGIKFFRQYSVGFYILDFYSPTKRLAIELDGSQHLTANAKEYDKVRTNYLQVHGIKTLRFWNNDVLKHLRQVLEKIEQEMNDLDFLPLES